MKVYPILLFLIIFTMCSPEKRALNDYRASAPLIIYKTKANYSSNVPIVLNDKKDRVVSYPSTEDVFYHGKLALPVKLSKGYYLDNVGINKNSVFTSYTFKKYSRLDTSPSLDVLLEQVIDKDPFLEIYDCGERMGKSMRDINHIVDSNFKGCRRIK